MKQLKNRYSEQPIELSREEALIRRLCVFETILSSMVALLEASDRFVPLADPNLKTAKKQIISRYQNKNGVVRDFSIMNDQIRDMLIALWNDEGIRETWERHRSEFQAQQSLEYYMNDAERVLRDDLVVTELDWLHVRVETKGIHTAKFNVEEVNFTSIEVGGARAERRKWIHVFEGVTATVFVSAISEYDEFLLEDGSMNRMQESLNLFEEMVNHESMEKSGMVLLFNKIDLFKRKICRIPIKYVDRGDPSKSRWEDFDGPEAVGANLDSPELAEAYEAAIKYFTNIFYSTNQYPKTKGEFKLPIYRSYPCCLKHMADVYVHAMCALDNDTDAMDVVLRACWDIILRRVFGEQGFLQE